MLLSLLLQAPAPVFNIVLSAGLAVVVGFVGWLLNRAINSFDTSVKDTKEAVNALTKLVGDMRLEMADGHRLVDYLEKRIETLEHKKETLEKSFQEMDKIIDRELIHKRTHP